MKDITTNIKKAVIGLGLLSLISLSLEAQKNKNDDYCMSRRGKKSTSHYNKKVENRNSCDYKPAKKIYKFTQPYNQIAYVNSCVLKQAKKYHRFYKKEIKKK